MMNIYIILGFVRPSSLELSRFIEGDRRPIEIEVLTQTHAVYKTFTISLYDTGYCTALRRLYWMPDIAK